MAMPKVTSPPKVKGVKTRKISSNSNFFVIIPKETLVKENYTPSTLHVSMERTGLDSSIRNLNESTGFSMHKVLPIPEESKSYSRY